MTKIKYCRRCFYHEHHPLGLIIDEEGICSGCRIHEEKDAIDWQKKWQELEKLTQNYQNKDKRNFDCIIPVSVGKDSFFIVDIVKNKLKMNPLLVTYNKQFNTASGIARLAKLKTAFDCDTLSLVVSPEKVKKITRVTLKHLGSIYWCNLAGETVFPVQVAVKMRIPLIIWGAHQGIDQVGMFSHHDQVEMSRRYRKDHDLMGYEAEDLLTLSNELTPSDIDSFIYPDENELSAVGVRGIYLNNYLRWDSKVQHDIMLDRYHYPTNREFRTFDTYNHIDCHHYSSLHDYIKLVKHGYSKVVDHATIQVRLKRIDQEEGLNLINQYITKFDLPDILQFADWVNMSSAEVNYHIHKFAHPLFWSRENGKFKFKNFYQENLVDRDTSLAVDLKLSKEWRIDQGNLIEKEKLCSKYILIGKGQKLNHDFYRNI